MRFRPVLSALLLAAYLPACTSFQGTAEPVASLTVPPKPAEQLRVTTFDGALVRVAAPRVAHDTLYGYIGAVEPGAATVAIPLSSIHLVEVQKNNTMGTILVTTGIVVGVFAVLGAIWAASDPIAIGAVY
jgi:hypothetical protein